MTAGDVARMAEIQKFFCFRPGWISFEAGRYRTLVWPQALRKFCVQGLTIDPTPGPAAN